MMSVKSTTRCTFCLCFALGCSFTGAFSAGVAAKGDSGTKQIQRVESKLNEEAGKLNAFQTKEAGLLTLVAKLEKQVADVMKETEALTSNIRQVRERLGGQKEKLKELKSVLMRTELKIGEYLIGLYKHSRRGNARILANADALNELRRNIKYISIVTKKDRLQLRALTEKAASHRDKIVKAEASSGATERVMKEKSSRLALLKTSLDEKVLLLMKIHEEKEFYETSVEELEVAVEDLKQALKPMDSENLYVIDPSLKFEDCKGKLPLPIRGMIVKNRKIGTVFSDDKGVVIQTDADSAVRAVYKGEVAYSGRLKGYGEVVILSHGGRYFTVSAHLTKREKIEGDRVQGGEILGWVDGNGSSKGAIVYFEVRKADKKLDPRAWLKVNY
jgi:murein hydrolase activator